MGIHNLTRLLREKAPQCLKEKPFDSFAGQKVAIDASMSLYQFLIAIRSSGGETSGGGRFYENLTAADGSVTSHISGMFYRTLKMLDKGIKPLYVFDGRSEIAKSSELQKRRDKLVAAQKQLEQAIESGNQDDIERHTKASTIVTTQQADDIKHLMSLMGLPTVQAAGEAEAQCAALVKAGIVYATATEDMDALTFGSSKLIRNLTFSFSGQKQTDAIEIDLSKVLSGLNLTMDQFIDVCILCGCDFASHIKGIGHNTAYESIVKHGSLEKVVEHYRLTDGKVKIPDDWPWREAQEIFKNPVIADPKSFKIEWTEPAYDKLIQYLVEQKGFDLNRVKAGCERLKKHRQKYSGTQSRLESFFQLTTPNPPNKPRADDKNKKAKPTFGTLGARGPQKKKKKQDDDDSEANTPVKKFKTKQESASSHTSSINTDPTSD